MKILSLEILCKVPMSSPSSSFWRGKASEKTEPYVDPEHLTLCFHCLSAGLEVHATMPYKSAQLIPIHTLVSLGFADVITYQMFGCLTVAHQPPLLNVYTRRVRLVLTVHIVEKMSFFLWCL